MYISVRDGFLAGNFFVTVGRADAGPDAP